MKRLRIALANQSLGHCPEMGGLWTLSLQYFHGLVDLGHDLLWLELMFSSGDEAVDSFHIDTFFERMRRYDLAQFCALLVADGDTFYPDLDECAIIGRSEAEVRAFTKSCDVMWNFACSFRRPLLSLAPFRVLIDGDPGQLQVTALDVDLNILDHDDYLSVGGKLGDADCAVPTLGVRWRHFLPVIHLPMWDVTPDPGERAPYTSITSWNWGELEHDGNLFSISKREAYLRYLELPFRSDRTFELATYLAPNDDTGDRDLLAANGWRLSEAKKVAASPESYVDFINRSRVELNCPKPIYRAMRTGWMSERSACYLATGRPVLAEDTGFSELLPTGEGLVAFSTEAEALEGMRDIEGRYAEHARAARNLVEEHMNARRVLPQMLS